MLSAAVTLSALDRKWYLDHVDRLGPATKVLRFDRPANQIHYAEVIRTDEAHIRNADDEELVRALILCLLASDRYDYPPKSFYIERWYTIGRPSLSRAEVDLIIYDEDELPFAMWEMKEPSKFAPEEEMAWKHQLFATAPQLGQPSLLVYATVYPTDPPDITCKVVDYTRYKTFDAWDDDGRPTT